MFECPNCKKEVRSRKRLRCPNCKVGIAKGKEFFTEDDYYMDKDGIFYKPVKMNTGIELVRVDENNTDTTK